MRRFAPPRPRLNDQPWSIARDRRPFGVRPPFFLPIADQEGLEGETFSLSPTLINAAGFSVTFSVNGTLPGGISINPATGALTGTFDGYGNFEVSIRATYSLGAVESNQFTIDVGELELVAGATLHLDPSDVVSVDVDGSNIVTGYWRDKSGNSRHISSTFGDGLWVPDPVLETNVQNGLAMLRFGNSEAKFLKGEHALNVLIGNGAADGTADWTASFVIKPIDITSNHQLWGHDNGSLDLTLFESGGNYFVRHPHVHSGGTTTTPSVQLASETAAIVVSVGRRSGQIFLSVNDGAEDVESAGTTDSGGLTFQISFGRDSQSGTYYIGYFGEMIVYNVQLSPSELAQNISFLMNKWGIS